MSARAESALQAILNDRVFLDRLLHENGFQIANHDFDSDEESFTDSDSDCGDHSREQQSTPENFYPSNAEIADIPASNVVRDDSAGTIADVENQIGNVDQTTAVTATVEIPDGGETSAPVTGAGLGANMPRTVADAGLAASTGGGLRTSITRTVTGAGFGSSMPRTGTIGGSGKPQLKRTKTSALQVADRLIAQKELAQKEKTLAPVPKLKSVTAPCAIPLLSSPLSDEEAEHLLGSNKRSANRSSPNRSFTKASIGNNTGGSNVSSVVKPASTLNRSNTLSMSNPSRQMSNQTHSHQSMRNTLQRANTGLLQTNTTQVGLERTNTAISTLSVSAMDQKTTAVTTNQKTIDVQKLSIQTPKTKNTTSSSTTSKAANLLNVKEDPLDKLERKKSMRAVRNTKMNPLTTSNTGVALGHTVRSNVHTNVHINPNTTVPPIGESLSAPIGLRDTTADLGSSPATPRRDLTNPHLEHDLETGLRLLEAVEEEDEIQTHALLSGSFANSNYHSTNQSINLHDNLHIESNDVSPQFGSPRPTSTHPILVTSMEHTSVSRNQAPTILGDQQSGETMQSTNNTQCQSTENNRDSVPPLNDGKPVVFVIDDANPRNGNKDLKPWVLPRFIRQTFGEGLRFIAGMLFIHLIGLCALWSPMDRTAFFKGQLIGFWNMVVLIVIFVQGNGNRIEQILGNGLVSIYGVGLAVCTTLLYASLVLFALPKQGLAAKDVDNIRNISTGVLTFIEIFDEAKELIIEKHGGEIGYNHAPNKSLHDVNPILRRLDYSYFSSENLRPFTEEITDPVTPDSLMAETGLAGPSAHVLKDGKVDPESMSLHDILDRNTAFTTTGVYNAIMPDLNAHWIAFLSLTVLFLAVLESLKYIIRNPRFKKPLGTTMSAITMITFGMYANAMSDGGKMTLWVNHIESNFKHLSPTTKARYPTTPIAKRAYVTKLVDNWTDSQNPGENFHWKDFSAAFEETYKVFRSISYETKKLDQLRESHPWDFCVSAIRRGLACVLGILLSIFFGILLPFLMPCFMDHKTCGTEMYVATRMSVNGTFEAVLKTLDGYVSQQKYKEKLLGKDFSDTSTTGDDLDNSPEGENNPDDITYNISDHVDHDDHHDDDGNHSPDNADEGSSLEFGTVAVGISRYYTTSSRTSQQKRVAFGSKKSKSNVSNKSSNKGKSSHHHSSITGVSAMVNADLPMPIKKQGRMTLLKSRTVGVVHEDEKPKEESSDLLPQNHRFCSSNTPLISSSPTPADDTSPTGVTGLFAALGNQNVNDDLQRLASFRVGPLSVSGGPSSGGMRTVPENDLYLPSPNSTKAEAFSDLTGKLTSEDVDDDIGGISVGNIHSTIPSISVTSSDDTRLGLDINTVKKNWRTLPANRRLRMAKLKSWTGGDSKRFDSHPKDFYSKISRDNLDTNGSTWTATHNKRANSGSWGPRNKKANSGSWGAHNKKANSGSWGAHNTKANSGSWDNKKVNSSSWNNGMCGRHMLAKNNWSTGSGGNRQHTKRGLDDIFGFGIAEESSSVEQQSYNGSRISNAQCPSGSTDLFRHRPGSSGDLFGHNSTYGHYGMYERAQDAQHYKSQEGCGLTNEASEYTLLNDLIPSISPNTASEPLQQKKGLLKFRAVVRRLILAMRILKSLEATDDTEREVLELHMSVEKKLLEPKSIFEDSIMLNSYTCGLAGKIVNHKNNKYLLLSTTEDWIGLCTQWREILPKFTSIRNPQKNLPIPMHQLTDPLRILQSCFSSLVEYRLHILLRKAKLKGEHRKMRVVPNTMFTPETAARASSGGMFEKGNTGYNETSTTRPPPRIFAFMSNDQLSFTEEELLYTMEKDPKRIPIYCTYFATVFQNYKTMIETLQTLHKLAAETWREEVSETLRTYIEQNERMKARAYAIIDVEERMNLERAIRRRADQQVWLFQYFLISLTYLCGDLAQFGQYLLKFLLPKDWVVYNEMCHELVKMHRSFRH